jgi:hypothetical protein
MFTKGSSAQRAIARHDRRQSETRQFMSSSFTWFSASSGWSSILFFLLGLLFLWGAFSQVFQAFRTHRWYLVFGCVTEAFVSGDTDNDGDTMWISSIAHEYVFRGTKYEGTFSPSDGWGWSSERFAGRALQHYEVGSRVEVFVNPRAPNESTLKAGIRPVSFIVTATIGLLLIFTTLRG